MNIYVFNGNHDAGNYGGVVIFAHNATEARQVWSGSAPGRTASDITLSRTIVLDRNPKAQIVASFIE